VLAHCLVFERTRAACLCICRCVFPVTSGKKKKRGIFMKRAVSIIFHFLKRKSRLTKSLCFVFVKFFLKILILRILR
jgi:hypothetical protein